jgi:ferredoxin
MPTVRLEGASYTLADGESVLAGLLRSGVAVNHSCKAGVCGTCMMRVLSGSVPARAQAGIKDSWKARGYFMPCVCIPEEDLELAAIGAASVTVRSLCR